MLNNNAVDHFTLWSVAHDFLDALQVHSNDSSPPPLLLHDDSPPRATTKQSLARAILTNKLFADSPSFFTYHEPVDGKVDSMHKLLEIKSKQAIKMLRKTFADSPTELGAPCAQELHTCAGGGFCGKEVKSKDNKVWRDSLQGICTCANERVWFESACVQHQALPST